MAIELTDRYGGRPPSWLRGCHGDCEAMGVVPIYRDHFVRAADGPARVERAEPVDEARDRHYHWEWWEAEDREPADDGWHFVRCYDCGGSGRASWRATIARIPRWVAKGIGFVVTSRTFRPAGEPRWRHTWLAIKCAFLADLGLWRP